MQMADGDAIAAVDSIAIARSIGEGYRQIHNRSQQVGSGFFVSELGKDFVVVSAP
jgi:hypothetical protein